MKIVSGPKRNVKIQHAIGRTKPAVSGGHLVPFVRVATELDNVKWLSKSVGVSRISVPASRVARAEFLLKWAREQRRKAISGGIAATLILPMLGTEAMAQSGSMTSLEELSGVASATVQPDGTLLIVMSNGAQLVVPEGQFKLGEDGAIFVSDAVVVAAVDANVGVESDMADVSGLLGALGGLAAVSLIGTSSTREVGNAAPGDTSVTGFVVDGYISGATVFYDENNNGILDDGEVSTKTDASGSFELSGDSEAPIVALGGIDISTGLPSSLVLKAPAGSTVVSPLTTMVQQLVSRADGTTVEAATASVLSALSLDPETDLLNDDPIADGNDALFAAGAQVAQFLALADAAGLPAEAAAEALAEALADPDVGTGLLSDAGALNAVLEAANTAAGDGAVELGSLAATIANSNAAINDAAAAGEDVQAAIADVQQAVMGNVANDIRNSEGAPREYTADEIAELAENVPEVGEDGTVIIDLGQSFSEDFDEAIRLANDQTEGAWYTDRQAPGKFETDSERFDGESVLRQTIDSYVESNTFVQTQGRKLDVPDGSTSVSIDLFVDPEWDAGGAQDGFRQAGFWATTFGPDGEVSGYPIMEFTSLGGEPGFRVWTGAEFTDFPLEGEISYGEFVTLSIALGSDGLVTYGIGDQTFTVEGLSTAGSTVGNVILQTYNQTFDENGDAQTDVARDEYSVYWNNLSSEGGVLAEDRDVSIFDAVSFEPDLFEVASEVTLTARMDQLDGVGIVGTGMVKLTGLFDADADLSGFLGTGVMIDATDVDGFTLSLTPEQADGLQLNVASDAQISIDVAFNELSAEQGELEPQIDITGITVDGQQDVAAVFDILSASGGFEDTMKLFWNAFDQAYYGAIGNTGSLEANTLFVQLGNIYADYLADGGTPITDVVQTKVGGDPNFDARQQSLHDNILGNIQDGVIARRFDNDDPRNDNAKSFGERPVVSGNVDDLEVFLAGAAFDISNGYERLDLVINLSEAFTGSDGNPVDIDVSIFAAVSLEPNQFEVADGATLTARMDQLDGIEVGGSGVVKLTGAFDADADLSGLLGTGVMIDATDVDGFTLSLTPEQGDGLQLNVASDAQISIDVAFNELSAEQGELEPQIDISGIKVDGQQDITAAFDVLSASDDDVDTFKLFWNAIDQAYYADIGDSGSLEANTLFVQLGNIYADYLADGGTPITDVVQTKVGGDPNFDARQQSLHDNILGNIQDGVIAGRFGNDDPRNDNAKSFGERTLVSGNVDGYAEAFLAGAAWDLENGYIRPDVEVPNETFTVVELDLESGGGTEGTDIIFSAATSNLIDISQGGADVILINADTVGRDNFTDQITGFDATEDGGDILQLVASGYASRGSELQLIENGGSLNDDTGIGIYVTEADLSAVIAEIDGESADQLEMEVLNFFDSFEGDPDIDGLFVVATDGEDSILGRFEFNDGGTEIAGLAYLEGVDGNDLMTENFNLDSVFGVQDISAASATT